jgi:glycosyltransferase involved in cell wall biosynthesis
VVVLSHRLGLTDGVSVVAKSWERALRRLGLDVVTVAGEGPVDRCVPGLAIRAAQPPPRRDVEEALAGADLVVVENLCTIPLNLAASRVVAQVLAGRPAILHHYDPPWQRPHFAHIDELPPTDAAWRHVAINELTRAELAERGIEAVTIYSGFPSGADGDRVRTRAALGVGACDRLVLHPVRAIHRKNIPAAIALAEALGATYWLTGAAEDGYGPELDRLLRAARCPVLRGPPPSGSIDDAYAACDLVAFPSTWEGFGNPPIEAAFHRRPVAVGDYPVAEELRRLGFVWLDPYDHVGLRDFLSAPAAEHEAVADHNEALARTHFSEEMVTAAVRQVVQSAGVSTRG